MISREQLTELRKHPTSSWALWGDAGDHSVSFFEEQQGRLKNDVVLVALNRSGVPSDWVNTFQNFHKPGHQGDAALRRIIQDGALTGLTGAYMTDLDETFETDSRKVRVDVERSGAKLEQQLSILGAEHVNIICFGGAVFAALQNFYKLKPITGEGFIYGHRPGPPRRTVYKVFHYALNGFNNKNVLHKLPAQLSAISARIQGAR